MAESTPWDAAAAVRACRIRSWSGEVWRCHSRNRAGDSASGSLKLSGRFNRGTDRFPEHDTWAALYTGIGQHVALAERIRHTTPEALQRLGNQRLSRLWVDLNDVLVACAPTGCADLSVPGLTRDEMCHPTDYTKTHEFACIARESVEALLVPTCTRFPEGNLIIFPDRLHATSSVHLIDSQDPDLFVDWANFP
ncbi:MAG: RES family NAD+ phosphorylase [Thermomicrobiales bacterium]